MSKVHRSMCELTASIWSHWFGTMIVIITDTRVNNSDTAARIDRLTHLELPSVNSRFESYSYTPAYATERLFSCKEKPSVYELHTHSRARTYAHTHAILVIPILHSRCRDMKLTWIVLSWDMNFRRKLLCCCMRVLCISRHVFDNSGNFSSVNNDVFERTED